MAWALIFDGVNDYATITTEDLHTEVGRTTFEYEIFAAPDVDQSTFRILGNPGAFTGQFSILTTGVQIRLGGAGASQVTIPYVQVFDGLYHTYKIRRDGNDYSFLIDEVEVATTTSSAATGGNGVQYIGRVSGNFTHTNIGYIIFRDSIAGTELFNWDATASSHAAGTPVLLDITGGNDATGVNMPTDGSAWVDLGGGGITVTPSTINSASVSNNPAITFNSVVSLTPNTIDSLSVANNPSIQFGSVLNISPLTIDSASVSNDPILSFSAVLNITPQAIDSVSAANDPSILFNSALSLTPSAIDSLSVSNNPVIEFKSVINVLPQTIDSLSVSKNPFISFGVVQTIGNVTASFKDSGISVKYEEDEINVG
ncbi:MAG TPA: hypothetical protein EYN67_01335, partial [Flavobacteriales bacterium]|nr:hypothetical protein [Flavobacteriales bacterium]